MRFQASQKRVGRIGGPRGPEKLRLNGFTLVEVIVALLVLGLALGTLTELFRASLTARRSAEETARKLEDARLLAKIVETRVSSIRQELVKAEAKSISVNGRPVVSVESETKNGRESTRVAVTSVVSPQGSEPRLVRLKSAGWTFVTIFDQRSRPAQIQIGQIRERGKDGRIFVPLSSLSLHVTGQRPCLFDSQTGACGELIPQ
ncbi:MAG: hypothetical protein CFE32_06385 [Alphaproteobacteria bacterium PA3]|nr:MAG: hypothetical protein CFE32_06385 [Alphaproteobacteria bacterium PA3]